MNSRDSGIYSITSKVNGKRYIGSSIRICDRWNRHLRDLKANKHHSPMLQRHFNKYGEDDLLFAVVEIVERGELSLQDFKQLLLDREQAYLDNWNECQFNCLPTAGSTLGYKHKDAKYYNYCNKRNQYITHYNINSKKVNFSYHLLEADAIKEVEYIKSLTEQELLDYKKECLDRPRRKPKDAKNYNFNKAANSYQTYFTVGGKSLTFSNHYTEEDAIKEVEYLKTLNDEELLEYKQKMLNKPRNPSRPYKPKKSAKNYFFDKLRGKYKVIFTVNGRSKHFGQYATEQEAIDRVIEVKQILY